jgi:hypothetical protein
VLTQPTYNLAPFVLPVRTTPLLNANSSAVAGSEITTEGNDLEGVAVGVQEEEKVVELLESLSFQLYTYDLQQYSLIPVNFIQRRASDQFSCGRSSSAGRTASELVDESRADAVATQSATPSWHAYVSSFDS